MPRDASEAIFAGAPVAAPGVLPANNMAAVRGYSSSAKAVNASAALSCLRTQHIGAYYLWPFIAGGGERYVMVSTSYPGNGWVREVVYLGSSVTAALGCGTTYYYGEWWYDGKSGCYWHWWDGFARKWYTVYDCTWQGPGG